MAYEYIDDLTTADVAFRAFAATLEQTFADACEAMMKVMVEDIASIRPVTKRAIELDNDELDLLLFDLLQEFIYLKDAEDLLLLPPALNISKVDGRWHLDGNACGEPIDRARHELLVDVKAVTLHLFRLEKTASGYECQVIVDV